MPIPPMVAVTVPIVIPIGRPLREDVIMSGTDVANCPVTPAVSELRGPIPILALPLRESIAPLTLHLSGSIGLDRSVEIRVTDRTKSLVRRSKILIVLKTCNPIAGPRIKCARRKLAANNRSVSAVNDATLRKLRR
jgi:hypothetical protein